ncbi:hypothetical protein [Nostoc sp. 106C]|jgi:hypothetical protein|uniref:hypothetical protein n=1 Tax=Nostoc sp. 106C TaxID=1932667 RepID=UPI001412B345|nr:hypothetical protein [Nostoc sp. 106C]
MSADEGNLETQSALDRTYRCGSRVSPLPETYYWRMMGEYLSMRMYQLEVKDSE